METDESKEFDSRLKQIYYNPKEPGSFGGKEALYRAAKQHGINNVTRPKVDDFAQTQRTYTLHKPCRKKFSRNPTVVHGIDSQWQADLADMQDYADSNDGNRYIFTVIDVFSKFAWAIPVKKKDSKLMKDAFVSLFEKSSPRIPERLQTDKGLEFYNSSVQNLLKSKHIHHFSTESSLKAAIVERFNRTLKTKIENYLTANQTHRYVDKLDDFLNSYNHSYHRSIGFCPANVTKQNESQIWQRLYGGNKLIFKPKEKLTKDDMVRISKIKRTFEKGYTPNWTTEHFYIDEKVTNPKSMYKLRDYQGEKIKGNFYPEEIQKITKNEYLIEKILARRKLKKRFQRSSRQMARVSIKI
jgi:hypothetical protein